MFAGDLGAVWMLFLSVLSIPLAAATMAWSIRRWPPEE